MKAIVKEIQVGGVYDAVNLEDACNKFCDCPRSKINFTIKLPNGEIKSITIRDEDDETVAYGDFEGLPSFLEYSRDVLGKETEK